MKLTIRQYESCNNQTNDALDAYTRAAELDPTNVHIKARLALLKGQPTTGLPNQAGAPLPQDVHPQAYQPGALGGGPPGPQWGAPAPGQAPAGPPPAPLGPNNDWNRRLADIQNPGMQPQTLNPYDQRDRLSQHVPRQPTPPRQEPARQYAEPQRPPPPSHRGLSPSPKVGYNAPAPYQTPQPAAQPPPPAAQHQAPPPPGRIANPNFGTQSTSVPPPPSSAIGAPANQGPLPPYSSRMASPPPEVRPIIDNQTRSPNGTAYPGQSYQPHPNAPSIASGAPAPSAAVQAAEAAAREREERPSSVAPKRHREWEDDNTTAVKKNANDESRSRLEDANSRRPSPPDHAATPLPRSPSEVRRVEDQRRADAGYHPSEAAHHPPLPPMQMAAPPQSAQVSPQQPQPPKEEPRMEHQATPVPTQAAHVPPPPPAPQQPQTYEPAARKMDMDEDYDDSGDEKAKAKSEKSSPRTNGEAAAPAS